MDDQKKELSEEEMVEDLLWKFRKTHQNSPLRWQDWNWNCGSLLLKS